MSDRLTITITRDGAPTILIDRDVLDVRIDQRNAWMELRSNPAMAAALAGAPPEALMKLPGEQVGYLLGESYIEVTYRLRFDLPSGQVTDFHEV